MLCGHLLGKGSWLSFVVSNCEFVTFPLVSWVGCGTWLYRFLVFAPLLTLYRGFRDTGYLPFYFQGHKILSILLPGIWDSVFNMPVYKLNMPIKFSGYGIFGTSIQATIIA